MRMDGEVEALREYVGMLERENEAKSVERETIYREIQALQAELRQMDCLYQNNRYLKEQVRRLSDINYQQANQIAAMNQYYQQLARQRDEVANLNSQKHLSLQKIESLQTTCLILRTENTSLQTIISMLQKQLNTYKLQNQQLIKQNQNIKSSVQNIQKERSKSATIQRQKELYERKLEELGENYYKVEAIMIEKQNENMQLNYELQQACQQLERQIEEYESVRQVLSQRDIMIDCLESQLEQLKSTFRRTGEEDMGQLESISKIDLIKQANILVERVNFLQKENRGQNHPVDTDSKTLLQLQELHMQYQNLVHSLAI